MPTDIPAGPSAYPTGRADPTFHPHTVSAESAVSGISWAAIVGGGVAAAAMAMLLAVLHRHAGIACFDQDVFLNAVGGVRIAEPGADLAVTLAVVSSLRNRPLPR